MISSCSKKEQQAAQLSMSEDVDSLVIPDFDSLPDFSCVNVENVLPLMQKLMQLHQDEVEKIADNKQLPSFENTVEALEFSGMPLDRMACIFNTLYYAETSAKLDSVAEVLLPKLKEHETGLLLNKKLFARIEKLYQAGPESYTEEQYRALEVYYKKFMRSGAALDDEQKKKLSDIEKQISFLEVQFSKNILSETNDYKLVVEDKADLAGIPQNVLDLAAADAKMAGLDGKWAFTLQKSSFVPFMQYAKNRELRRKLYEAYYSRGGANEPIVNAILNLRTEKAHLLGFDSYADFVLDGNMAANTANVYGLLDELWRYARKKALSEAKDLQKLIDEEGGGFTLQAWDWWYYAEKIRQRKYNLNEEALRSYLSLDNVRDGAFMLAKKLWGVNITEMSGVKTYNEDVVVYRVTDKDGSELGVLYTDYFPRKGKRAGAWMDELTRQYKLNGENHRPVVINVANFTRPTADVPSLLNLDEAETLFHEFGHAMNSIFSQCTYPSVSGVSTPSDFVEMPSQLLENWVTEPQMLKLYAKHYKTGETIPDSLIAQVQKSKRFNRGFEMTELLAAAYLDLNVHSITEVHEEQRSIRDLENHYLKTLCMPEMISPRYGLLHFNHSFSFGYEAAYYSYVWSRVLSSSVFSKFKRSGSIFDNQTAEAYRTEILEKGNSADPMALYVNFMGTAPSVNMLIEEIR
ncbi:MAG: M3 family metallopeptidase [Paludibacteraceae bacterium]|nr:M3 family metallopeptidase [Paludibacteraceae bacterium]